MLKVVTVPRRDFLKYGALVGTGLLLGLGQSAADQTQAFTPSAFLSISEDGLVTVTVAKAEMGQGVRTALPMLIAEELDADWSKIRVEQALAGKQYGDMGTGGSSSIKTNYEPLRRVGATARYLLLSAAAQAWQVPISECKAKQGQVLHPSTGRSRSYGSLARAAATIPMPKTITLKDSKDFTVIGTSKKRVDGSQIVQGQATYGIDVRLPGMLFASLVRCPIFGGKVAKFDGTRAEQIAGVKRVLQIPQGIAVVATSTWAALKGREQLKITWDTNGIKPTDSKTIRANLAQLAAKPGAVAHKAGDVKAAFSSASRTLEAVYEVPFLAHATMEPLNCVAVVTQDRCEIWTGTQVAQDVQKDAAALLGFPPQAVKVHVTLMGGGFGRRLETDYVLEAVQIAKALKAPVQLLWTREDDIQHGFYRPTSYHALRGGLDASGQLTAWTHRVVTPSILQRVYPAAIKNGIDGAALEGIRNMPYAIPNVQTEGHIAQTPVPVGWWRAVYNVQNAFANEGFISELASAAQVDPYQFRRRLLNQSPRLQGVLDLAAQKANWDKPLPKGQFRGIACYHYADCGTYAAQVVELTVEKDTIHVKRVVCALDCGVAVNPLNIRAQIEGAIAYGLAAVLASEVTIAGGRVEQANFDTYPVLRLDQMPVVQVHLVPSSEAPGGLGEPGVPPLAPAIASAVYAATGKRVRSLPIRL